MSYNTAQKEEIALEIGLYGDGYFQPTRCAISPPTHLVRMTSEPSRMDITRRLLYA